VLVSAVDADGALWLRRVTPEFTATAPVQLTRPDQGRVKGFPRMALLRDYRGGTEPAQILVTLTRENVAGLHTLLVTVPEGGLLEAEKNCDCASTPEQLQGFPIRGSMVAAQADTGTARVKHFEVPGIFGEGTREFKLAPEALASLGEPGRQFLGRVERRNGEWWLFDLRFIVSVPSR
jgi:hypothetical protein